MNNKTIKYNKNKISVNIDQIFKIIQEGQPKILQELLDKGIPIIYMDENNNMVREFPDGEVQIINNEPGYGDLGSE